MEFPGGLTLGLILSLIALVYWKVKEIYKFFEKKGIPYVEPTFLLGSDVRGVFLQKPICETRTDIYNKLDGHKLGGFFMLIKPVYMVRDPEYINKIFISDFSHFHDRVGGEIDEETNPLEGHLLFLRGQKWKYLRNKLSPIFTSGKLKWMYEEMHKCGDAFMEHLKTLAGTKDLDCKDDLARFSTDVIGSCAFGFDSDSLKNPDSQFRAMGRKVFQPSMTGIFKFVLRGVFPSILKKLKIKTIDAEVNDFFISTIKQAFEYRIKTKSQRKDMIHFLLQLRQKGSIEIEVKNVEDEQTQDLAIPDNFTIEFTDELLAAQSFVFFIAGFETASTTMYFTFYLLSKNPKVQNKLREEVERVKEKFGEFTYESLNELEYLEKCLSETMRMYPPVPSLVRTCTKDYTFPNGATIEKGNMIIIPVYSLHRDPKYFPEPDSYIPERFDNPPHPGVYWPFGGGPRICIGKRFALIEMKMALARIIDCYSFEESSLNKNPIELSTNAFILSPKDGLKIRIEKLNK